MDHSAHIQIEAHSISYHHGKHHDSFLVWFIKKIPSYLRTIIKSVMAIVKLFGALFVGVLIFLSGFGGDVHVVMVKEYLWIFLLPVLVFILGTYFTLLPFLFVVALVIASLFLPAKYVFMSLWTIMFFSFFIVFLI